MLHIPQSFDISKKLFVSRINIALPNMFFSSINGVSTYKKCCVKVEIICILMTLKCWLPHAIVKFKQANEFDDIIEVIYAEGLTLKDN